MQKSLNLFVLVLALVTPTVSIATEDSDWILDAMQAELDRSVDGLQLDDFEKPYFIAYSVRDTLRWYASAKLGALFQSQSNHGRMVAVEVRVGDYDLDSSQDRHDFFNSEQKWIPNSIAPVDDSEVALRQSLWQQTDFRYKGALMSFLNVKAGRVNEAEKKAVPSFSKQEKLELVESAKPLDFDLPGWEERIRKISALMQNYPDIIDHSVEVSAVRLTRYLLTTEGTKVRTVDDYFQFHAVMIARATDGQMIEDTVTIYGREPGDLPSIEDLTVKVKAKAEQVVLLRNARVLEPRTVPVLMSPEATGVFFHETIGHRLEGQRQDDEEEGRTFRGYVGQKILPEFLDIYDDPSVASAEGLSLNGHYRVDDEGVSATKASLVENGVLKGFLMSRKPNEDSKDSNGHGRNDGYHEPAARMANMFVRGHKPKSPKELEKMLLEEARRQGKPYGLIVDTIAGGATNTSSYGFQAFKGIPRIAWRVDAKTGERELVRGFELVGTPLSAIGKIIATSGRYGVFNGYCGAESGSVPVSMIAPQVLFKEIELQRAEDTKERAPIMPAPWVGAKR